MSKQYRVITKDSDSKYTLMTNWTTKSECKQYIIGRWGHWPPFAFISTAKTDQTIKRVLGL